MSRAEPLVTATEKTTQTNSDEKYVFFLGPQQLDTIFIEKMGNIQKISVEKLGEEIGDPTIRWTNDILITQSVYDQLSSYQDLNIASYASNPPEIDSRFFMPDTVTKTKLITKIAAANENDDINRIDKKKCKLKLSYMGPTLGWGVTAKSDILEGELITIYAGEIVKNIKKGDRYIGEIDTADHCYQSGLTHRNFGAFIQDLPNPKEIHSLSSNYLFDDNTIKAKIATANVMGLCLGQEETSTFTPIIAYYAIRDIKREEIIGYSYGEGYWVLQPYKRYLFDTNGQIISPNTYRQKCIYKKPLEEIEQINFISLSPFKQENSPAPSIADTIYEIRQLCEGENRLFELGFDITFLLLYVLQNYELKLNEEVTEFSQNKQVIDQSLLDLDATKLDNICLRALFCSIANSFTTLGKHNLYTIEKKSSPQLAWNFWVILHDIYFSRSTLDRPASTNKKQLQHFVATLLILEKYRDGFNDSYQLNPNLPKQPIAQFNKEAITKQLTQFNLFKAKKAAKKEQASVTETSVETASEARVSSSSFIP